MKKSDLQLHEVLPERAPFQAGFHNLHSRRVLDDWENLPEISSQEQDLPTEWRFVPHQVSKSPVQSFHHMAVHHRGFVPDNNQGFRDEL